MACLDDEAGRESFALAKLDLLDALLLITKIFKQNKAIIKKEIK
jgi:hypothetical protein